MKNSKTTLESICNKYCKIDYKNNYSIRGGLDDSKFASRRHEDAKWDEGKLTLGEATQLFKKATGLDTNSVREVLEYAVPYMEWHHAGKLPKSYGGGMKKTYFLNAEQICDCAKNWDAHFEKFNQSKIDANKECEERKNLEDRKNAFLQANAKRFERISNTPKDKHYFTTAIEMNGKYGWFESSSRYKLPEYYSGWEFENEEMYNKYFSIK